MKRALVVDDSKIARVALKKQLEEYEIAVETADSGEEALEFLKHDYVDVIFMDHVMPGMDGLTAVRELKGNPRTATIPVMMYTSKEGEVYVSQARALGAVDVLPKQVQPGVLYGMLIKLGLVRDRRKASNDEGDGGSRNGADAGADQALGTPLPELLARIIADQYSVMRSDLLTTQRNFAKYVADEVFERQRVEREVEESKAPAQPFIVQHALPLLTALLALTTIVFAALFVDARIDRNDGSAPTTAADAARSAGSVATNPAAADAAAADVEAIMADRRNLLDTLAWTLNQTGIVGFGGVPFNGARAEQIVTLTSQLASAGFEGTLRVESHLGEFCLDVDANGNYLLADPATPVADCAMIGHPLDASSSLAERQTPGFAAAIEDARLAVSPAIRLEVVANDRMSSVPLVPYPPLPVLAGDWNQVATRNNRVEFTLISE
ncbi:MAG: response regulator [Woeseiaceae bacterium]|nr:response regulator [Woeseiaceae bacterium]